MTMNSYTLERVSINMEQGNGEKNRRKEIIPVSERVILIRFEIKPEDLYTTTADSNVG